MREVIDAVRTFTDFENVDWSVKVSKNSDGYYYITIMYQGQYVAKVDTVWEDVIINGQASVDSVCIGVMNQILMEVFEFPPILRLGSYCNIEANDNGPCWWIRVHYNNIPT